MVIERFGDLEVFDALEDDVGERLTLDEVIAREMSTITAPLDEVVAWMLGHVRIRPGFGELVEAHDPLIVSAGFHETIDPILAREGIVARVVANHVTADPAGWRSSFPDGPTCEVCGERCKRVAVAALDAVRVRRRRGLRPVRLARRGTTLRPCGARDVARRAARRVRAVRRSLRRPARAAAGAQLELAPSAPCRRKEVPATVEGDDRRRAPHSIKTVR